MSITHVSINPSSTVFYRTLSAEVDRLNKMNVKKIECVLQPTLSDNYVGDWNEIQLIEIITPYRAVVFKSIFTTFSLTFGNDFQLLYTIWFYFNSFF